ncbi:MAG: RNA degradosome polyphosphate kinase [Clostridia bacterium]|nr:RNA degradosome polyphosphate kinase [Clostridia bacterium]
MADREFIVQCSNDLRPEHCINRELSWLEFNQRVLEEALSPDNPPFERMKFLSIVSSNLDEFFMIRVASLWDQIDAGYNQPDVAGMTPRQQVSVITARVRVMMERMYEALRKGIMPSLETAGVSIKSRKTITPEQLEYADKYFDEQIYPVLTPMAVDSRRPFPLILNRSLNLGLLIDEGDSEPPSFATVQVPGGLPRLVRLPDKGTVSFAMLEQIISRNIGKLFPGRDVLCCHAYRITRNADLTIDEDDADDLLKEVEKRLRQRRWGFAVRLEIDYRADTRLVKILEDALELEGGDAYPIHGPINLDFLMKQLYNLEGYDHYKYPPYTPRQLVLGEGESMFDRIRAGDLMLYHPYDSFDPVIRFVRQAARDPKVLAIKQTLYRVSGESPIIAALAEAADAGKQVTVLLELKARFDEENNIHWGRRLERAGAHVIYGMAGLKTHSKITLVVRAEDDGIRRYVHLATGNYNDVTARTYTDHGLFTCDPKFGADASAFFNMLTGFSKLPPLEKLVSAPRDMREKFYMLIERETQFAMAGKRAEIFAKMNSLVDEGIIAALYRASTAGVGIKLIVRGICCLRPGLPGISENIQVRSIVGRFLEHSRIFMFHNDGIPEVYMSSADWMPRNLNRRVELLFPIEDQANKKRAAELLRLQWRDNVKSSTLGRDGHYSRAGKPDEKRINSQEALMEMYHES